MIQRLRLEAILEDCSDQLDILGHSLTLRLSREQGPTSAKEQARLTNLRSDCESNSENVCQLHLELEENLSFSFVQHEVEEEEEREKAENIRCEVKRKLEQRKKTQQRQQDELRQKTELLQEMDQHIKDLRQEVNEQVSKIIGIENILELTQKERDHSEELLMNKLELLNQQLEEEKRVHMESEKFLQKKFEELQKLKHWEQSTEQMMQEREELLNSIGSKRTVNLDRLAEMRRKLADMQQVVMEDRDEQELLLTMEAEETAATRIQAWWRGCIVRHGVNVLKKDEEAKKGKKEGKKKKKK